MNDEALKAARGDIIEKSINLEIIMSAIICQHYLGAVKDNFLFEVLLDEHFSFGFKRRIIEKIVPMSTGLKEKLGKLNKIRNYFAHWGPRVFWGAALPTDVESFIIPDRRHPHERLDFEALYEEFKKLEPQVTKHLFQFTKKLGMSPIPAPKKVNHTL